MFFARMVDHAKWKKRKVGRFTRVPPDGLTNNLRIQNDRLSFWMCDPKQEASLEQVVLALASSRDSIDRLDLVWVDEIDILATKARILEIEGETPAHTIRKQHRDVADLGLNGVIKLAHYIAKAINGNQTKRWSKSQVQKIMVDAVNNNTLDLDQLKEGIRSKLLSNCAVPR